MTAGMFAGRWMRTVRWVSAAGLAAVLAACGGGGGGTATGQGTLRVALTDAPSCGWDHVWVTVEKVRVHQNSEAADGDAGWSEVVLAPAKRIDLLDLTNGVLEELGSTQLAAGSYSQVRLVLTGNSGTGATAVANAVQPTGGSLIPLATPSGQQSGLKLKANFTVQSGQTADLVLDFDACKSVVKAGNSGNYNLKPVISVVPRVAAGIQGYVTTTLALSSTTVAAQQDGVTIRSTMPDATGKFSIPYLSTGTYTIVVTSDGRATSVVTGVPVGTTTTTINSTTTSIAPTTSTMADLTGTVVASTLEGTSTVSVVVTDANVTVLQMLTGGPTIGVASQPVDSVLGTYAFRVPTAAPLKAPYAAGGSLLFTADSAAANNYTVHVDVADEGP